MSLRNEGIVNIMFIAGFDVRWDDVFLARWQVPFTETLPERGRPVSITRSPFESS
jgi:hypothetical protein